MKLTVGSPIVRGNGANQESVPLEYPVLGLPPRQSAEIRTFVGERHWQILRIKDGVSSDWQGQYLSAQAALIELQAQVDAGR
jgi:hypothetical protein